MKTLAKIFVLASLALSPPVFAVCVQMTQAQIDSEVAKGFPSFKLWQIRIPFMQQIISIDPRLEVGGVIATATSTPLATYNNFADCPDGGKIQLTPTSTPSTIPGVYETRTPGIGYRVSYVRAGGSASILPFTPSIPPGPASGNWARFGVGSFFKIELIRTGDLQPLNPVVNLPQVGIGTTDGDHQQVISINMTGVMIRVLPHCSVAAKQLNIEFGTFGPDDVSTTDGPTQPVDFTVECIGPTPPVSITATLSGTPDKENPSLIKNDGAAHLAIRLRDKSSGTILKPNDPNSKLVQKPGGKLQSPFQLDATVLRVGAATPPPGKIQATATIIMTLN